MDFNVELFKGKTFSELMKDIYSNSSKKDRQINMLIGELKSLIKNVGDATVLVPLIKEYLEVSVKNDEHLVKLAAIVQRLVSSSTKSENDGDPGNFGLTEEEKEALLKEAENSIIELQKEQNATTSRS